MYRTYGRGSKNPEYQRAWDELVKWLRKNVKFSWFRMGMVSNPPFEWF